VLNAFATPGGYVYFTRGIMAHFNDEAQFAGVLGHEIGHITARHAVEQQRNQMLGQFGLIVGMVLSPQLAQFGEAASQGLGLLFLKFSRDAERESDELGVQYSTKIGYDARRMADFFTTLERASQASGSAELPDFLSTHPNPGDRHRTVATLAVEEQKKQGVTNPVVNRNSYLQMIDGLIYGEDPKQGYKENNMFYHPELRFQFPIPANWLYQNSPQAVQMAAPDGKAMMMLTLAQGTSLNQAASAAMQQYKLTVVESREVSVNGLPALAVVADQATQQGTLRTLNYFIQYNNAIYHMLGVTAAATYSSYVNLFSNTMQGFRPLTDQAKINKKADRIRIKTVSSARTLAQALRDNGVPETRMNELAILNGMQLNETLAAGAMFKVIAQ
jgi:predicted Zn-dependent protease